MKHTVSIIIPFHSNKTQLSLCLDSIKNTTPADTEVIIVANNSDKEKLDFDLTVDGRELHIHRIEKNMGYPSAINYGARKAKGKYLVFCDDDVTCSDGWYDKHLSYHELNQAVGITASKLINQETGRIRNFGMANGVNNIFHPFRGRPRDFYPTTFDQEFSMISSAHMMILRKLFNDIGGYDEELFYYFSDPDLCQRVTSKGLKCVALADAICVHRGNSSYGNRDKYYEEQERLYVMKNPQRPTHEVSYFFEKQDTSLFNHPTLKEGCYIININSRSDSSLFIEYIRKHVNVLDVFDVHFNSRKDELLSLVDLLGYSLITLDRPLIYHCECYYNLRENSLWKKLRSNKADLVVDRHTNIIPLSLVKADGA